MSLKYGITVRFDDNVRDLAKQFPKAASAVLNRAVSKARTEVVNDLAADINLTKAQIRKRIFVRNAKADYLYATIRMSQRGINPWWFLKKKEATTRREPVILEIKKGSTMFPGNKFFAQIGTKSGKLKVMRQPGEDRKKLALMPFIKGNTIFKTEPITNTIRKVVEPYLQKELPRVIEAWYKSGRDLF